MRKFRAIFVTCLKDAFSYRAEGLIYFFGDFISPLVMMFTWICIYHQTAQIGNYSLNQMLNYYLCILIFGTLLSVYPNEVSREIKNGDFSSRLLKPVNIFQFFFTNEISWKIIRIIFLVGAIFVLHIIFPGKISISFSDLLNPLVILSSIIGLTLNYFSKMTLELISFWTTEVKNFRRSFYILEGFFSGYFLPIDLMPKSLAWIASLLPYKYYYSFPAQIAMGRLTLPEILSQFLPEILWLIILWAVSRLLFKYGVKRYSAVGS
jgi:ABC-2 type transport system permease protein